MWITVAILAVVISVLQFGDFAARSLHRRGARSGRLLLFRPLGGPRPVPATADAVDKG